MTEIKLIGSKCRLEIKGHCGYAEKGKDIVCSAVSSLFYTLARTAELCSEMMERPSEIVDNDGDAVIQMYPKKEFEQNILWSIWTVMNGFELLSEQYPDNVKIIIPNDVTN